MQQRIQELTAEVKALRQENERLSSTLAGESAVQGLTAQMEKLVGRYGRLKSLLIEHLDASA